MERPIPERIKSVALIGGDSRQGYLANMFAADGYKTFVCGLEHCKYLSEDVTQTDLQQAVNAADVVILPLPLSKDSITINAPFSYTPIFMSDLFGSINQSQLVVGGMMNKTLAAAVSDRGIKLIDYFQREELSILNAIPTAEGAVEIAMRETITTIFGSHCLVAGYGRVGKALARLLQALGAHVTVSARKCADFAWIKACGFACVESDCIKQLADSFDIIFNTVPSVLFDDFTLAKIKPDALIIDLASLPGGVDFEAAASRGLRVIQAQSLPGKVAPVSAAVIIKETILNIIQEEFA